jgi:hypothetical protein|tara:strand:+ start:85 stop:231 length:147 start_codon:yes stop_codon:yes gene_type:complete
MYYVECGGKRLKKHAKRVRSVVGWLKKKRFTEKVKSEKGRRGATALYL